MSLNDEELKPGEGRSEGTIRLRRWGHRPGTARSCDTIRAINYWICWRRDKWHCPRPSSHPVTSTHTGSPDTQHIWARGTKKNGISYSLQICCSLQHRVIQLHHHSASFGGWIMNKLILNIIKQPFVISKAVFVIIMNFTFNIEC